jgi:hypothetical protein
MALDSSIKPTTAAVPLVALASLPDLRRIDAQGHLVISFPDKVAGQGKLGEDHQVDIFCLGRFNLLDGVFKVGFDIQQDRIGLVDTHFHGWDPFLPRQNHGRWQV